MVCLISAHFPCILLVNSSRSVDGIGLRRLLLSVMIPSRPLPLPLSQILTGTPTSLPLCLLFSLLLHDTTCFRLDSSPSSSLPALPAPCISISIPSSSLPGFFGKDIFSGVQHNPDLPSSSGEGINGKRPVWGSWIWFGEAEVLSAWYIRGR